MGLKQINVNNTLVTSVDDEPISGSENLVMSDGVAETNGYYIEDDNWLKAVADNRGRILFGLTTNKELYIAPFIVNQRESAKVDKEEGMSLINSDFSESISFVENDTFLIALADLRGRIVVGLKRDGETYFGKFPKQISDEISRIDERIDAIEPPSKVSLTGAGMTAQTKQINVHSGHIYKIYVDNPNWNVSEITGDTYVVLACGISGNNILRVTKGERKGNQLYYVKTTGSLLSVTIRANLGVVVNFTFTDVTEEYINEMYDVHFENVDNAYKSYTVKLPKNSLIKYAAGSDGTNPVMKIFSRNTENVSYLIDSVISETVGNVEGEFFMKEDGFVTVFSTTANPSFKVLTNNDVNYSRILPHQIYFDTDNLITLMSNTDPDANLYDNYNLNNAVIIPVNDNLYCMLYMGFGGSNTSVANILMAYSTDLIHWTRGILPDVQNPPYPGTNAIFLHGNIVGEFADEMVNEFAVAKVDDSEYPYRMFCAIRNANPSTIEGECHYMFKSSDLVHWTPIKKVLRHAHDTYPSMISYGDKLHIYLRMWDYSQSDWSKKRMIGDLWTDIWGNVIAPPSGVWGNGLYNPAATRIGPDRELFVPTNYHYTNVSLNQGDDTYETYIRDGNDIFYAPSFNLPNLKKSTDDDGWSWSTGLIGNGENVYIIYRGGNTKHGFPNDKSEFRLCPVKWITRDSYNTAGGNY